jgi:hypothetical protein
MTSLVIAVADTLFIELLLQSLGLTTGAFSFPKIISNQLHNRITVVYTCVIGQGNYL